jgi:hypothetical protein
MKLVSIPLLRYWMPYAAATLAMLAVAVGAVWRGVVELKDLVIAVLPLLTTFAGATLAFRLNLAREAEKEADRKKQAMNTALFVLVQQDNAIRQILRDYEARTSDFERAFNLPANKPPEYAHLKVPISDLVFLLDSHPQLLFELSIEQERFDQALDAVRIRNAFYVEEVQPAIERTGMLGRTVTILEAEKLLGQRIFGAAMNQAKTVLDHVSSSKVSIPLAVTQLRAAAKDQFPGAPFVNYVPAPEK